MTKDTHDAPVLSALAKEVMPAAGPWRTDWEHMSGLPVILLVEANDGTRHATECNYENEKLIAWAEINTEVEHGRSL